MTASSDSFDDYIDAASGAIGLAIDEVWKPAVRANLATALTFARLVDEFPLPDDIEPASVFKA